MALRQRLAGTGADGLIDYSWSRRSWNRRSATSVPTSITTPRIASVADTRRHPRSGSDGGGASVSVGAGRARCAAGRRGGGGRAGRLDHDRAGHRRVDRARVGVRPRRVERDRRGRPVAEAPGIERAVTGRRRVRRAVLIGPRHGVADLDRDTRRIEREVRDRDRGVGSERRARRDPCREQRRHAGHRPSPHPCHPDLLRAVGAPAHGYVGGASGGFAASSDGSPGQEEHQPAEHGQAGDPPRGGRVRVPHRRAPPCRSAVAAPRSTPPGPRPCPSCSGAACRGTDTSRRP